VTSHIRCLTPKCGTLSAVDAQADRHWQFQCTRCQFWNLVSSGGSVQATSRDPFDLDRLPWNVRNLDVKRSPPGGV
jgi:hypothetical protein